MTETFDAAWLELREEIDHESRAADLLEPLTAWWDASQGSAVLDLGCGTGSNLRYLAPKLSGTQHWTLVDHDAALLAHVQAPSQDVHVALVEGDLAEAGLAKVEQADLVTASALLDLVSESWMTTLVDACVGAGCGAFLSLSYDGKIEWSTTDPLDALVRAAINEHQRGDKGLGSALGPAAATTAEVLFRRRGYRTWLSPSPWRLGPTEAGLAQALIAGWADAAADQRPAEADEISAWAERRREAVIGGDVRLTVGHQDLLALPGDDRPGPS